MPLDARVISAEKEIWRGSADLVVARTHEGELGVMAGHAPLLATLVPGQVRITDSQGKQTILEVSRGFLSVNQNVLEVVAGSITVIQA